MQEKQLQQQQEAAQMQQQEAQAAREFDMKKHDDEISVKREKIASDERIAGMKEIASGLKESMKYDNDLDDNGIDDELDLRRTETDENFKKDTIKVKQEELEEKKRSNKANEQLKAKQIAAAKQAKKEQAKSKTTK